MIISQLNNEEVQRSCPLPDHKRQWDNTRYDITNITADFHNVTKADARACSASLRRHYNLHSSTIL